MGWVVNATLWPLYPRGETQYPLYSRLGGPQGRSGQVRKITPTPGFDPRTVQPVADRYTDCIIPGSIGGWMGNISSLDPLDNSIKIAYPVCNWTTIPRLLNPQPIFAHKLIGEEHTV